MTLTVEDPYAGDYTPRVTIDVGLVEGGKVTGWETFADIEEYSFDSDILTISDSFAIVVGNPDGVHTGKIRMGAPVKLWMADPAVNGGAKTLRLTGLVTGLRSVARGGSKLLVQGSDLGWHLGNCDAPLWAVLTNVASFDDLVQKLMRDKSGNSRGWGFATNAAGEIFVEYDNTRNFTLQLGRAGLQRSALYRAAQGQKIIQFVPPIQIGEGQKIGDVLVNYARLGKRLVNVTSDGALVVWQPKADGKAVYRFDFHSDKRRTQNNVEDVQIEERIDGVYTDVTCVAERVYSQKFANREDPNANKLRGRYRDAAALPFYRMSTFTDADQIGQGAVTARAQWHAQRGLFDSWTYTLEAFGHSQSGAFFVPGAFCALDDTVNGVQGTYFVSACRYTRRLGSEGGTRTTLTLRRKGLLSA